MSMAHMYMISAITLPRPLISAHKAAEPNVPPDKWEIDVYGCPAHPLTDDIAGILGSSPQGVSCGYARLHRDDDLCWRGKWFVSLVITGDHYVECAQPAGLADAPSVYAVPGKLFALRPQSWHCAIPDGRKAPPLRLAQWEVPTRRMKPAVKALRQWAETR